MMAPAHIGAAALVGALAYPAQPLLAGITILAGLFPDIDQPNSLIGRGAFFISGPLRLLLGHRTITHSLIGAALTALGVIALAGAAGVQYAGGLAWPWLLGYASHLALDGLTLRGVPLLWPYQRYFGLPLGRSGGLIDFLMMVGLAFVWLGTSWGRAALSNFF